jgi:putative addiction module killer protein
MIEIEMTEVFSKWLKKLRDEKAKGLISLRTQRLKFGHLGDGKSIGDGVIEMRIDSGPGYRVYFTRRGDKLILLLVGGTKRNQQADIDKAKAMTKNL